MPTRLSRFQGSLMGVRIGDALGMPFEILTRDQIAELTGPTGVTSFLAPQHGAFDVPNWAKKLGGFKAGDCTDDWQMTRAGAQSLIFTHGQLNLHNLAWYYLAEMNRQKLGWDGTTVRGLVEIETWLKSQQTQGREPGTFATFPDEHQPGDGCGNGVAMRIAPHGLLVHRAYQNGRLMPGTLIPFQEIVWYVGGLTHPDPRASIGAFAIASLIARLASNEGEPFTRERLVPSLSDLCLQIISMELSQEALVHMPSGVEAFSTRLDLVKTLFKEGAGPTRFATELGTSCYTLESVPFSIAMALCHPTDFRSALKATIEAGGDTDTNAAIVGAIVGANVGLEGIPEEWRTFRPDFWEATKLGSELYGLSEQIRLAATQT